MKKLNVAFCLRDMQIGGVESVLIRTLDALLKQQNVIIYMVTYVDIHEDVCKQYFVAHPEIKLVSLYPCQWLGTKLPRFFLWRLIMHFARDVYRWCKRFFMMKNLKDIDVFIDYHDMGFVDELKKIKSAKKIAWFHSSLGVFIKQKFVNRLKFYDKLVVLTDECANDLMTLYPQYSNKITRIYNPIDIDNIRSIADKKSVLKGRYFCSVSRLSGDKDIKTLLDAFDLFWQKNKGPDVKLVLVGDGNKAEDHKKYARSLKSYEHIVFVGMQNNPFVYMQYALANILSSYAEGFALVLVEAAAVGTLNIASNCKYGPKEILLDGRSGMLFEPGNYQQLAKCMDDVYNKKVDVPAMIKEMDASLNRFEIKTIIKEIKSLFL